MKINYKKSIMLGFSLSLAFFKIEAQCNAVSYSQTPSNNGCAFDYITNVTFSTINRNSTCDTYTMVSTPNPTLTQGLSYVLSISTGGDVEGVRAWIDYNIDGTFNNVAGTELVLGPSFLNTNPATYTALVTIPLTSSLGATRLRARCSYNGSPTDATSNQSYGETEDYCITIAGTPSCSGTPTVPVVSLSGATGCPNSIYTISATTNTGAGISYQWQSSASSSGPFSSISGATTAVLTSTAASNIFYQLITTCANGSGTVASAVVAYTVANPGPCVCNNYAGSSPANGGDEDIYLVNFGTLNNPSTCTTVASGVGSIANRYSNYTGVVTAPTVCSGSSVNYTVNVGSCSTTFYGVSTAIYIDYNQNGMFTDPGELAMSNTSFTNFVAPVISGSAIAVYTGVIVVPQTASLGLTRMRVITFEQIGVPTPTGTPAFSYGETEDYCINIINPSPITLASSATVCSGQPYVIAPSGASSYTYVSASTTLTGSSATFTPFATTNYTVNYTSSNGCVMMGAAAQVVSVTALTTPTISVNNGTICSGNSFSIIPTGANTYTIQGGSSNVSPTTSTNYTVIGTATNGCTSANTATSNVTVNTTPTISVNSGTICSGNSFSIVPAGANTYTIQGGSSNVSPTTSTNYTVAGTATNGCISANTATSNITVNTTPTVSVNSGTICSGNSFSIIPVGANTYTIQGGFSNVSPTSTSNYTVKGTSAQGCLSANTATSNVVVNTTPTISVNSGTICSGNSFSIIPVGANTYTIQGGSSNVSPTSTSNYTVKGTSAQGCLSANTATSNVIVNTTPTISVNNGTICSGNSFSIVPSGANTYTIQGGSSNVSPTASTNYTVIGTATNGCTSANTATSNVTVNTTPTISVNSGTICSGNSFSIIPTGANTYTIQGGSSNVSPTSTSNYTVNGTSVQGCLSANTATSNVVVNTTPTVSVNSGTICSGNSFSIIPTGANTYTIQGGSSNVSPVASTDYTVIGTATNGCISANTATSNVTVNTTPTISVNSGTICSGNSFSIIPAGANTYTIQGGSSNVSPTSTSNYTVNGTSAQGCLSANTATSNVVVNTTPTISVNNGTICSGNSFSIIPVGANTFTIQGGSSNVSPTASTNYTVIGTATNGCTSANTATSNVTVNTTPTISVNSGTICSGNSFSIIPVGANTYTIQGGSSNVSPTASTNYTVIGTATNGCTSANTATSNVTVNTTPTISVNSGTICEGNSFTINPSGAATYTISGGNTVVNPTVTTSYSVSGTSVEGCTGATVVNTVVVNSLPLVTLSSSNGTICVGESVVLSAIGASSFVWNTSATDASISVSPTVTMVYTVTGTASNGCAKTFTISQEVSPCTSVDEVLKATQSIINIYPNPNNGEFAISSNTNVKLTLMNEIGQVIKSFSILANSSENVSIAELSNGIYFVIGQDANQNIKQKIIVNK